MAEGFIHTVYRHGAWLNEIEGGTHLSAQYVTKAAAIDGGRVVAIKRKTEHVIHNLDGTIPERNLYGSDPGIIPDD